MLHYVVQATPEDILAVESEAVRALSTMPRSVTAVVLPHRSIWEGVRQRLASNSQSVSALRMARCYFRMFVENR